MDRPQPVSSSAWNRFKYYCGCDEAHRQAVDTNIQLAASELKGYQEKLAVAEGSNTVQDWKEVHQLRPNLSPSYHIPDFRVRRRDLNFLARFVYWAVAGFFRWILGVSALEKKYNQLVQQTEAEFKKVENEKVILAGNPEGLIKLRLDESTLVIKAVVASNSEETVISLIAIAMKEMLQHSSIINIQGEDGEVDFEQLGFRKIHQETDTIFVFDKADLSKFVKRLSSSWQDKVSSLSQPSLFEQSQAVEAD
jgi:hypothetical protein